MIINLEHCPHCDALLTSADDEAGACTQCGRELPELRALLVKIASSCADHYVTGKASDLQVVEWLNLNLGDARLARRLLKGELK